MSIDFVCGVDEVGRGCVAGPIVAAAAMFVLEESQLLDKDGCRIKGVKDSKRFSSHEARVKVRALIQSSLNFMGVGFGIVYADEIDKIGIEEANHRVFEMAVKNLVRQPDFVLVDGIKAIRGIPDDQQLYIAKADDIFWPVSAASILAKTRRDQMMHEIHKDRPEYGFIDHVGYGTEQHMNAIRAYGTTRHHRKSFLKNIRGEE